jgi:signal transduction histidine kinase
MKLLNKYSSVYILTSCIVLLISSIAYYFIIRSILLQQIDKDLKVEEQEITDFVIANKKLPYASNYKHQLIKFEQLNNEVGTRQTLNTLEYDTTANEFEPYRRLSFPIAVNGVRFKASVYKSVVETEDLLRLIMFVTAVIFVVLSALIFIINRFVLGKLWKPFFNTLAELKHFDLHAKRQLNLSPTNISEFEELNRSVAQMTDKVTNDYQTLKAFTDNASHEMQTPLAIIRSKLDLLIQSSHENQVDQLQAIYNATGRITKLNKTLLLLTKIENNQYKQPEVVNLKILLEQKFQQFDELIKGKNLNLNYTLDDVSLNINKELAELLFNNLLSNAIQHNHNEGTIECKLESTTFSIANSGPALTFKSANIFDRFQKGSHSEGSGLGLAVAKQICDASDLTITYVYTNNKHKIVLGLKRL